MSTLLLFERPLLQVAGLVFDAELVVGRGQKRQYTARRVGAGVTLTDHSRVLPRVWNLEGCVSALPQPQNIGRPGARKPTPGQVTIVANFAEGSRSGSLTRLQDFEADLEALINRGLEVDVVCKTVPRFRAVINEWGAQTTAETGEQARYALTLEEAQRAGLTIALATPDALALTGSGVMTPGPSQTIPGTFVPVP